MNLSKVLVVDDSAALQQIYKITLSRYMCHVIPALSGLEGLNSLADNPDTNLLIVDINMPHMNGLEFITKVKEQEAYHDIPIITVSTRKKDDAVDKATEAQAFALAQGNLIKPFTSNEIHSLVEGLFPQTPVHLPVGENAATSPRPSPSRSTLRTLSSFVRRAW